MRALTLTQPWAGLVASGIKLVENRSRPMVKADDFGKTFAIHASRAIDASVYDLIHREAPEIGRGDVHASFAPPWGALSRITSAVIAVATLVDAMYIGGCDQATIAKACVRAFGEGHTQERWTFGPTCYVLRDVRALPVPVPCKGKLGFWTLPLAVELDVQRQLA